MPLCKKCRGRISLEATTITKGAKKTYLCNKCSKRQDEYFRGYNKVNDKVAMKISKWIN